MRDKDLRKEAKKRGLRGYSSLNKAQLIQYLATGAHPLQPKTVFNPDQGAKSTVASENQIQTAPSEAVLTLPSDISLENLPVKQILCGDCLSILPSLPDTVFDCCIADPPFNISQKKGLGWAFSSHITMQEGWDIFSKDEYFQFTLDWVTEVLRVVKPNGNIFVFGSFHSIFILPSLPDSPILLSSIAASRIHRSIYLKRRGWAGRLVPILPCRKVGIFSQKTNISSLHSIGLLKS